MLSKKSTKMGKVGFLSTIIKDCDQKTFEKEIQNIINMDTVEDLLKEAKEDKLKLEKFETLNNQNAAFREQIENVNNEIFNIRKKIKQKQPKEDKRDILNKEIKLDLNFPDM